MPLASSARRDNGLASRLQNVRHPRRRAPPSDRAAALARCCPSHSTPLASPPPGASTVSLRGCSAYVTRAGAHRRAIALPCTRDVAHLTRRLSPLLRPARQRSRFAAAGRTAPAPARAAERSRCRARATSPISLDAFRLSSARVELGRCRVHRRQRQGILHRLQGQIQLRIR